MTSKLAMARQSHHAVHAPRPGRRGGESLTMASRRIPAVQYRLSTGTSDSSRADRGVAFGHPPPRAGTFRITRLSQAPQATNPASHATIHGPVTNSALSAWVCRSSSDVIGARLRSSVPIWATRTTVRAQTAAIATTTKMAHGVELL